MHFSFIVILTGVLHANSLRLLAEHTRQISTESPRIPKIVFFGGNWNPEEVVNNSKAMVEPGTEFRYFNLPQVRASVVNIARLIQNQTGTNGALEAFDALRPISFKFDLWRAMILWQFGGTYIDAKLQLKAPLSHWVDDSSDLSLCYDAYVDTQAPEFDYWTAMLSAPKRSPMLLAIIQKIIGNVKMRVYPNRGKHSDLFVTGPGAYTEALVGYKQKQQIEQQHNDTKPHCVCQHINSNVIAHGSVVAEQSEALHRAMRSCDTCNKYGDLFKKRQVYCDEEGDSCEIIFPSDPLQKAEHAKYWSKIVW